MNAAQRTGRGVALRALAWLAALAGIVALAQAGWTRTAIGLAIAVFAAMLFWPRRLGGAEHCERLERPDGRDS